MTESDIEDAFVGGIKLLGGIPYKFTSPGRRGVPDRIAVMPFGLTVYVELKAPGQKPDPHQLREHERLRSRGHKVYVIDSLEGVKQLLKELESCVSTPKP